METSRLTVKFQSYRAHKRSRKVPEHLQKRWWLRTIGTAVSILPLLLGAWQKVEQLLQDAAPGGTTLV